MLTIRLASKTDTIGQKWLVVFLYSTVATVATERRPLMTQLCVTALIIAVMYNITKVVIKKMELSYMDRKNQKEGRYMN